VIPLGIAPDSAHRLDRAVSECLALY